MYLSTYLLISTKHSFFGQKQSTVYRHNHISSEVRLQPIHVFEVTTVLSKPTVKVKVVL